jgi:hypothetical protein
MVGSVDIGPQNFDVTVRQRRIYDVEHLEDAERAFAIQADTAVINLTLEAPVHNIELESHEYVVELLNPIIEVEAVIANFMLSEYDQALITLYSYYGSASITKDAFTKLDQLVRVDLYKGTNGITT